MAVDEVFAELEVLHTRPTVATRRVALGHLVLPTRPPPGSGGMLLGAVVARFAPGVPPDLRPDIVALIDEVCAGTRVVQPRLRHRYQVDRHGLARSVHRLSGRFDQIVFDFDSAGTDLVQVLGAVYAVERLDWSLRPVLRGVLHRALVWEGTIGPALLAFLAGADRDDVDMLADPRGWAAAQLGLAAHPQPTITEINAAFRRRVSEVHPDHGGDTAGAARAITDLRRARRILTPRPGP